MSECYVMLTYVIVALSLCETVSVTMLKSSFAFTILLYIIWPFPQLELHQNILSWMEKSFTFFYDEAQRGIVVSVSTLLDFTRIEFHTSWWHVWWSCSSQFTIRKLFDGYLEMKSWIFSNISSSPWNFIHQLKYLFYIYREKMELWHESRILVRDVNDENFPFGTPGISRSSFESTKKSTLHSRNVNKADNRVFAGVESSRP